MTFVKYLHRFSYILLSFGVLWIVFLIIGHLVLDFEHKQLYYNRVKRQFSNDLDALDGFDGMI